MRTPRHRPGISLLEVMVVSAIMSMMAAVIFMVLHHSTRTYTNESMHLNLDHRSRDLILEIERDLRESSRETFSTGDARLPVVDGTVYDDLRFGVDPAYDLTERKLQYLRTVRYRFRLDPGELANGVDDNRDGMPDEGFIEKTDPAGVVTRIGSDIRSPGLTFQAQGRRVILTLTVERRDPRGTLIRRDVTTSVDLRNGP